VELDLAFTRLEEWEHWRDDNPWATDPSYVAQIVESAQRWGIVSPFLGPIPADQIQVVDRDFRESFRARGFNARFRAVLDQLALMRETADPYAVRIYAPEALSRFALALRGRFPRFLGSEYLPDPETRRKLYPVPHEDLCRLSFPDAVFDIVVCNEVFEHVPELSEAIAEIARVLRPGGILLATFPFAYNQFDAIVKAEQRGGEVRFLCDPEYHSDPLDPRGSLVYQIPGWDILERVRKQGFAHAENRFVVSRSRGICGAELAGIFLMRAVR
jgi:SAM-dependent methyltransferase